MAAKTDPDVIAHRAWLGLVQPVGLVVSPTAMVAAQCLPDLAGAVRLQPELRALLASDPPQHREHTFWAVARDLLGWPPALVAGAPHPDAPALDPAWCVALPEHHDALRPDWALLDPVEPSKRVALVCLCPHDNLDEPDPDTARGWHASPQARLERLLREQDLPVGVLASPGAVRLVYAPRGESSGHLTFTLASMAEVAGRPIFAAFLALLGAFSLFDAPEKRALPFILAQSRKHQNHVSNRLAEQVLDALWTLLRGFQEADEQAKGRVFADLPRDNPQAIYAGLLTVLLRLIFLLYAEERGLLSASTIYAQHYSVLALYEKLRADVGKHPDTMGDRHGAWPWLLSLFRFVYDGGGHGDLQLPTRHGQLFDPDEHPFLEGRHAPRSLGATIDAPRVSDACVWRVLESLLVLDGERLSYRALDVEQIGSVYEAMMGFEVASLPGRALGVRVKTKGGSVPLLLDADALLKLAPKARYPSFQEQTQEDLPPNAQKLLAEARDPNDLAAALGRKAARLPSHHSTDDAQDLLLLPPGALFFQPNQERRRTGSHYTPRELTEPVVQHTLQPLLQALGTHPTPDQILALKVCDPAMGSGAFLVETCRQLAAALVQAWTTHRCTPPLPADEDPLLHARRIVAQRCLYGVDRNPFAVSLARLSLWLVTMARDHAFTFLDHALKHGDSLVGLSLDQIVSFTWEPSRKDAELTTFRALRQHVQQAREARQRLQALPEDAYLEQRALWRQAEEGVNEVRRAHALLVAAYFAKDTDKERHLLRQRLLDPDYAAQHAPELLASLQRGPSPVYPFAWEIEFPEVFERHNPGFDAFVGNPPFLGGKRISTVSGDAYRDFIARLEGSNSNMDLSAHFFRRTFDLLRQGGTLGLIATNTIAQGDTRLGGLRWICTHHGHIYRATRRYKWPGLAAVVVSVAHIYKVGTRPDAPSPTLPACVLDGREVPQITAYLFHGGGHESPAPLEANKGKAFVGSYVLGMGFTFDDTNPEATPLAEMHRLIEKNPKNSEKIFPYIGGEDLNSHPQQLHNKYVINFGEISEQNAQNWPDLYNILEKKVKPERIIKDSKKYPRMVFEWWKFWSYRPNLYESIKNLKYVIAIARISNSFALTRLNSNQIFNEKIIIFPFENFKSFSILQSKPHEIWTRFFSSTMKDDLQYTPSDCFETFPFPPNWEEDERLEAVGQAYYEHRAALMVAHNEGLTKTYNRFHDPDESSEGIVRLRELHAAMDRAVLDAYGWTDIEPVSEFIPEHEDDEAEADEGGRRGRAKTKKHRYRWPDEVRDEVLGRLMALNAARHAEEVRRGQAASGKEDGGVKGKRGKGGQDAAGPQASEASEGKRRGRPPGSKNKPKDDGGKSGGGGNLSLF